MKPLPLWSAIMVPIYGYGDETASSAAVESSFKKLKTITFQQDNLPITIEDFLQPSNSNEEFKTQSNVNSQANDKILNETHQNSEVVEHTYMLSDPENDFLIIPDQSNCPMCFEGIDTGTQKCSYCGKPVHAISSCSTYVPETNVNEENNVCETWSRKNKKQRKTNSYLQPNIHLRHLNLNNSRQIKSLPILKNGSRSEKLKSCKSNVTQEKIVLTNTCAFDSLASLIMVSYCDSILYAENIDSVGQSQFLNFITKIIKNGITSSTYTERADIIITKLNPELKLTEYNTTLAICDSTMGNVVQSMFAEFPTIKETIRCTSNFQTKYNTQVYLTYQTDDGHINNLQRFINNRQLTEKSLCTQDVSGNNCDGLKQILSEFSDMHLFIDVLHWEGSNKITFRSFKYKKINY
ncbi:Uncharacterized protein FWK35_00031160 [Aphis craccivora]|uniref:Uncharacterized protein n=1 Tax=Aphis craccivora TaxID=307492 RepID=A0A6G0VVD8_APHCR|nr:Uncharacterized protein FWK35_00031160 [Aphis craccivora]